MEVTTQQAYKSLISEITNSQKLKSNLLIITLPGTGMGRFITEYISQADTKIFSKITGPNQPLTNFNIINLDWAQPEVLSQIETIFKSATPDQKIAVSINYPHLLKTEELKKSFFLNHIYKTYYFGVRSLEDTAILVKEINPKLTIEEIKQIHVISGGFAQIIKQLAVNGLQSSDNLDVVKKPIDFAIQNCDPETLAKLGVLDSTNLNIPKTFDIKTNFDLGFTELGQLNPQKLTAFEKIVLEKIIENNGEITKSQVSDIKWGEGKYDEFSDQAINKAMRRLDEKLTKFKIETIPKVGFILVKI